MLTELTFAILKYGFLVLLWIFVGLYGAFAVQGCGNAQPAQVAGSSP